jgi:hypothetical protein
LRLERRDAGGGQGDREGRGEEGRAAAYHPHWRP